jgi:hypothetical protein
LGIEEALTLLRKYAFDRLISREKEDHMRIKHPYKPFPIDRLEAAVSAVPLDAFPAAERELTTFGRAHRFWCACILEALRPR